MNINDQAIQWLFKIRSFSYSHGLIYPLNYSVKDITRLFFVDCNNKYILDWVGKNMERIVEYFYDLERFDYMGG